MARAVRTRTKIGWTVAVWVVALLIFFPILYTIITSLKTESEAIAGFNLIPSFTFENFVEVQTQRDYFKPFMNSVIIAVGATLIGTTIAIPAAWSMAFSPSKRTKDILMWMLSTKMMPAAAVLVPIYFIFLRAGLLDSRIGITLMLMLIDLPIVVWMLYTYFREIPGEILEAARMDGASLWNEIIYVLTPMAVPGIASTMLLNIILAWNESFWTIQLTTTNAAPLTAFIATFSSPQGLFWAKLSAASTLAIAPILIMGWFSQKQLVRGLTFEAARLAGAQSSAKCPDETVRSGGSASEDALRGRGTQRIGVRSQALPCRLGLGLKLRGRGRDLGLGLGTGAGKDVSPLRQGCTTHVVHLLVDLAPRRRRLLLEFGDRGLCVVRRTFCECARRPDRLFAQRDRPQDRPEQQPIEHDGQHEHEEDDPEDGQIRDHLTSRNCSGALTSRQTAQRRTLIYTIRSARKPRTSVKSGSG